MSAPYTSLDPLPSGFIDQMHFTLTAPLSTYSQRE